MSMNAPADDSPFDEFIAEGVAATVYDADTVSHPRSITLLYSGLRYTPMIGTVRGNVILGLVTTASAVVVSDTLQVGGRWFLVAKVGDESISPLYDPGIGLLLLRLPYSLPIIRPSSGQQAAPRNAWFELAGTSPTDTSGRIPGMAVSHSVVAGFSNSNNPLDETVVGPTENGLYTAYVPLGVDVQLGDQTIILDNRPAQVDTLNTLYADGAAYALQPILRLTMGTGLATS